MKKIAAVLCCLLMLSMLFIPSFAQESSSTAFTILVNKQSDATIAVGSRITVTLLLSASSEENVIANGIEDNIRFDSAYFRLDENSVTYNSIFTKDDVSALNGKDGMPNRIYATYASQSAVDISREEMELVSFQLIALKAGKTAIQNDRTYIINGNQSMNFIASDASINIVEISSAPELVLAPSHVSGKLICTNLSSQPVSVGLYAAAYSPSGQMNMIASLGAKQLAALGWQEIDASYLSSGAKVYALSGNFIPMAVNCTPCQGHFKF